MRFQEKAGVPLSGWLESGLALLLAGRALGHLLECDALASEQGQNTVLARQVRSAHDHEDRALALKVLLHLLSHAHIAIVIDTLE